MKIFRIDPLSIDGDFHFRELFPADPKGWIDALKDAVANGRMIPLVWGVGSSSKPLSDLFVFPSSGLPLRQAAFEGLRSWFLDCKIAPFFVGDDGPFVFIQPNNYQERHDRLPHVFWMWSKWHGTLVTEQFKVAWESLGLTGAIFEVVGEITDQQFVEIP